MKKQLEVLPSQPGDHGYVVCQSRFEELPELFRLDVIGWQVSIAGTRYEVTPIFKSNLPEPGQAYEEIDVFWWTGDSYTRGSCHEVYPDLETIKQDFYGLNRDTKLLVVVG